MAWYWTFATSLLTLFSASLVFLAASMATMRRRCSAYLADPIPFPGVGFTLAFPWLPWPAFLDSPISSPVLCLAMKSAVRMRLFFSLSSSLMTCLVWAWLRLERTAA